MLIDLVLAAMLWLVLFALFGRFIAPRWKVAGKAVFFLAVAAALSAWVGHWSLIWIIGHPLLGVWGHIWWCRQHQINWITCEPRDKYLALRPWAAGDGFAKVSGRQ
jgi:hypothetical protein